MRQMEQSFIPSDNLQESAAEVPATEQQTIVLDRDKMLQELLEWCNNFVKRSAEWRRTSFEDNWRKWQRNADGIYDPDLAKKKESWQSRAFWPVTPSHRENAQAQLYRTEISPKPPLDVKARNGSIQDQSQADIVRDLIIREREKSRYEIGRNDVIEDKTTYGSGFSQMFFETRIEDRLINEPIFEEVNPGDMASIQRAMSGQRQVTGYNKVVKPQVIYRGVKFRPISIWDVFPDPKSLSIRGNTVAIRYNITYGEIVEGARPGVDGKPGYVLPEAVEKLKDVSSQEISPSDKMKVESDRHIVQSGAIRTDYQKNLECYEIQGRIPKKWILINGEEIDNPDELIPGVVRFHQRTIISVELNPSYDGEPNIDKDDYFKVAGQFYGRGIPEMLSHVQEVTNESVNQRLDSAALSLLAVYAVIEKSVVDPKDFKIGQGSVLRFKAQDGISNVDALFKKIEMGTIDRNSYIEPQEWERVAQERTSITRTSLGTEANTTTTLGAQQIQMGVTNVKMAYIGMLSEANYLYDVTHRFYKLIYSNYNPEDVALALGQERAAQFVPMTPEQVENNFAYMFMGVFSAENKAQRQARLAAIRQQFVGAPWINDVEFARTELATADEDPDKFIIQEADAMQIQGKAQQMAQGMAQQAAPQMAQEMMVQMMKAEGVKKKMADMAEDSTNPVSDKEAD